MIRVGSIGVGTVGSHVVKILQENADIITARSGKKIIPVMGVVKDLTKKRDITIPLSTNVDDVLENDISTKFRTIKGKDFISKLGEFWSAKGERMLIILYEFLLHLKEKKLILGPNIKNEFIEILKSFTPTYRPFIINQEDKELLIKWCEENLEDIEIIDIMTSSSTIEKVIASVKNELNIFNKYTI